jgi:hypothetical protein
MYKSHYYDNRYKSASALKHRSQVLDTIRGTSKHAPDRPGGIAIDDALHARVGPCAEEKQPDEDDEDVQGQHRVAVQGLFPEPVGAAVDPPHADVRHAPEDEPEEGVKEGGHQREQVGEEGDNLSLGSGQSMLIRGVSGVLTMMKAPTQVAARIPAQVDQPMTV